MRKISMLLIFLLFIVLAWASWRWYKNTVACCEEEIVEVVYGPLIFDCATDAPITNEKWPDKKAEIIAGRIAEKKLLIVAPYFEGEDESVALARANNVKMLFMPELADKDVVVDVRSGGNCEATKIDLMHQSVFKWVTRNEDVVEHLDHTVVYYVYNSTQEIVTPNSGAYFEELSKLLVETGDKIVLTGHTDDVGSDEFNLQLGMDRANEFKEHLVGLGVPEAQISTQSKGKSMPVTDDTSEIGQQKNRRVEIHIIDNKLNQE